MIHVPLSALRHSALKTRAPHCTPRRPGAAPGGCYVQPESLFWAVKPDSECLLAPGRSTKPAGMQQLPAGACPVRRELGLSYECRAQPEPIIN
jgi:hypothetical protein